MTPSSHPEPITVGDLTNDLISLASWIDAAGTVVSAIRPHDFVFVPPPGWVPGGPKPIPRALPICFFPVVSSEREIRATDLSDILDALRNWTASIGETLSRLPQGMEVPPPGPGPANS